MNIINSDEMQLIYSYLSLQDKINLRLCSKVFESLVKKREMAYLSIEKKVHRFFSLVMKPGSELVLAVNNNYIMYLDIYSIHRQSRTHPLFKISNNNPKCINSNCREKRLDKIYISVHRGQIPQYLRTMYYIKRNIPYCIHCFNKWGIDAYLNHPQTK